MNCIRGHRGKQAYSVDIAFTGLLVVRSNTKIQKRQQNSIKKLYDSNFNAHIFHRFNGMI